MWKETVAAALLCSCASEYTIVDRSEIKISPNARVVARAVVPGIGDKAAVEEHMALAQEVYERQLNLLKERRNKVRARRRNLGFAALGVLAATSLAAGATALASRGQNGDTALAAAGGTALGGLGLASALEIASLTQEEYGDVDAKIRHLDSLYTNLLNNVRNLVRDAAQPGADTQIGAIIEGFIHDALQIHIKG
jgi:hypothetical protein